MAFFVSALTLAFFLAYLNLTLPHSSVNNHASFHYATAVNEFQPLTPHNSLATILLSKPSLSKHRVFYVCILILLSGDIETNPGPSHATTELSHTLFPSESSFTLCSYNTRSASNEDHTIYLHDFASSYNPNCFALTETWLKCSTTPSQYLSIPPPGYHMICANRDSLHPNALGGGVAFIIHKSITILSTSTYSFSSFEALSVKLDLTSSNLSVLNIYRPPPGSPYHQPFSVFLSEIEPLLSSFATMSHPFIITGDFNIHLDNPNEPHTITFSSLLSSVNLIQHVTFPTHKSNHTLDLVITSEDPALKP